MSPLKVAIFTGNYHHIRDGVSLTLNRLVKYLEEKGVQVLVFGPTVDEPAFQHNGNLIPVPSIAAPGRPEYRISTYLPKDSKVELQVFDPDIIHIATPDILGFKALRWGIRRNKVIVASYHTHFTSYLKYYRLQFLERLGWKYLRWFYRQCVQLYVPSTSMMESLEKNGLNGNMKLWARGVDTDRFHPDKRDQKWREKYGIAPDEVIISFVSRLVWEKNLETYYRTVQAVTEEFSNARAMVVGDGPAKPELEKQLPEAIYTGFLTGDELARAYANSDIFLFPSDTETFGNVTLEAMSSGLPCVVADAVGSKSLVDDQINGYLVPVSNLNEFIDKVKTLADDQSLRVRMGRKSREISQHYAWENINKQLLSYYREALNDKE